MKQRVVSPEYLDSLPHTDPAARRSRRELRLINRIMGNHRWLAAELRGGGCGHGRVLELGAGDAPLLTDVSAGSGLDAAQWTALDLAPPPQNWPPAARWHQGDVFRLGKLPDAEVVVANLFLHHFDAEGLRWLGANLPTGCRLFLANEPVRGRLHVVQGRLLSWLARFNQVTRHDMERSIEAGFRGEELPRLLGLDGWEFRIECSLLGAYRMRAWR
jgi:hypothetical protein